MSLIDDIMQDSGLDESQRSTVERRMNGVLASASRLAGRSLLPGEWSERHRPVNGRVFVGNPPIRAMLSSYTDFDSETGCVNVGTDSDVTIEYEGGPEELPADIYMALLSLSQGEQNPGIVSQQVYDVGSVTFAQPGDPVLGHYCDMFRQFRSVSSLIGRSTILASEAL